MNRTSSFLPIETYRIRCTRMLLLAAALIVLGGRPALGQDWVGMVFPDRAHDFGTVARGAKLHHVFPIVNRSQYDVHIYDWHPKCGCTEVTVGARSIPPGTQTTVEAILDTTRFQGYKASGLTLVLDRPQYIQVDLNFTCFIRGDLLMSPGQVDFGVVAHGSKPTLQLTLDYMGGASDWAITKAAATSPSLNVTVVPFHRSPGYAARYQLVAALDASTPPGDFTDEILLTTNDPSTPRIPVSVAAKVQSAVAISPSILNLGHVRPGQTVVEHVFVRSSQPFKVTEAKPGGSDLQATDAEGAERPLHTITVTFKAPSQPGSYHDELAIGTNLKGEPPAKLTVFATIGP